MYPKVVSIKTKTSLEGTLAETQERYSAQLSRLQNRVTGLEAQLSQLYANIASNKQEYDMLLDLKPGWSWKSQSTGGCWMGRMKVVTKVITVVQTVVDGKVIESSKTVDVDVDEIE
ncbi:Keratin type I cytoskeletal 18 [Dissostichus eleginoides]|uniref:Keratin type I cytoskeletal 18 n=1 Tax=Dissostichus eleginoides TaxID=100907 RepID=A0AAD9BX66_DISEL|nr:Keratin type I cytoskeletal 18 [Dissostichus eleginoides]